MAKLIAKRSSKPFLALFIFILMTGWMFSSWPKIWSDPQFPPKIQEVHAAWGVPKIGTPAIVASGDLTLTEPAGIAQGDLMVAAIAYRSNAAFGLPAGWALVATQQSSGNTDATNGIASGVMAYIIRGASAPDLVFTRTAGNRAQGVIIAYSGALSTPYDTGTANTLGAASVTVTTGTFSTAGAGELIVAMTSAGDNLTASAFDAATDPTTASGTTDTTTAPTAGTWLERFDAGDGTGADGALAVADAIRSGAGATGTIQATISTSARHVMIAGAFKLAPIVAPTVTLSAATNKEATTATLNGNVTVTGGENPTVTMYWGDNDGGQVAGNWDNSSAPTSPAQPQGVAAFSKDATGLPTGTTIYFSAKATNSGGTGWPAASLNFLTKPAAPTSVAASDGTFTDKVTITWVQSTGATDYHVWRDSTDLGAAGNVATFDDTGAGAPTITAGSAVATDGTSTAQVSLSLSGASANNGSSHTYKVVASNATGNSADSATDTGYRGVGALTYQWQRSASTTDANYSNIDGATASTYDDTAAPAGTVTAGTASATDGSSTSFVTLSISGDSANNGEVRYYKVILNATGASQQTSASNDGYRGVGALTYQWYRSSGTGDSGFSSLGGATTDPYNDTGAPAPSVTAGTASASDETSTDQVVLSISGESATAGEARYYYATVSATGASSADTNHDNGNIGVGSLTYQWYRSSGTGDSGFSSLGGATTDPYNDTGAPAPTITVGTIAASDATSVLHVVLGVSGQGTSVGAGRYYYATVSATGASSADTNHDRGNRSVGAIPYQW